MGRVLRPSHPPISLPAAPSRGLARINVSGVDPCGPLAAVHDRIDGAGTVSSITGLYQLLADLGHAGPNAPAATLDLIGASTCHGLLQLGSSVIDASVPAVLDLFEWIGHEGVLRQLGIRELRLIGSRTAIEPAAHDTMRRLAELVGVPVTGTTTVIYRDHFRRAGIDGDLDATMIDARSLPPRKVPALLPEQAPRARELGFDAVGLTSESALPSVAWPRFVVPRGLDVLAQVRIGDGRSLPGLLALPRCELLIPAGKLLGAERYRVVEVLFNWDAVRIAGPELPDGAVYPVISPQKFLRQFIGLPQFQS